MLHKFFRKIAPVAALAMGLAVSGCDDMNVNFDSDKGVPLSELDMSGDTPTELAVAGPDTVRLTEGDELAITVEGDSEVTDVLRFAIEGDTLLVTRKNKSNVNGSAVVNVTMPAPKQISALGSGTIEAKSLADEADVNILGSGKVTTGAIKVSSLNVNIGGSGEFRSSGAAEQLDLNIGGSGSASMGALKVGKASINIGGSGSTDFSSDGDVEANILGSGDVTVRGSAKCKINAMGSGTLYCDSGDTSGSETPTAPQPPAAPDSPANEG